jgi:hypothetical protein
VEETNAEVLLAAQLTEADFLVDKDLRVEETNGIAEATLAAYLIEPDFLVDEDYRVDMAIAEALHGAHLTEAAC